MNKHTLEIKFYHDDHLWTEYRFDSDVENEFYNDGSIAEGARKIMAALQELPFNFKLNCIAGGDTRFTPETMTQEELEKHRPKLEDMMKAMGLQMPEKEPNDDSGK